MSNEMIIKLNRILRKGNPLSLKVDREGNPCLRNGCVKFEPFGLQHILDENLCGGGIRLFLHIFLQYAQSGKWEISNPEINCTNILFPGTIFLDYFSRECILCAVRLGQRWMLDYELIDGLASTDVSWHVITCMSPSFEVV